ncbi:MAG: hypothetical protein U0893_15590 [Chloroflexota bacterium]
MSELSTADLAGGTTPRSRDADMATTTRDPQFDDRRDDQYDADATGRNTFDSRQMTPPTSTPGTAGLANPAATDGADTSGAEPLFPTGEAQGFRSRWTEVQTGFVDEPRSAVEQADGLVAEMMKRLATVFADERAKLEEQWSRGDDISTEDLRQALRRYRSFFDRLLSV